MKPEFNKPNFGLAEYRIIFEDDFEKNFFGFKLRLN